MSVAADMKAQLEALFTSSTCRNRAGSTVR
jgi:hypothetical protein